MDRDQRIADLRDEYWNLRFEASRPRATDLMEQAERRMIMIKAALAALGVDVGPKPVDFPPDTE